MRKDKKTTYQTKKEKLQKIRAMIARWNTVEISKEVNEMVWSEGLIQNEELSKMEKKMFQTLKNIWKLVENEK